MSQDNSSAGQHVEDVREILPDLAAKTGCDDWLESRSPLQRRDCRIHFLRSATFRLPEVVLKSYRADNSSRNHVRALFRRIRSFHQRSTAECTVPEYLLFVPRRNALVMEYVAAPLAGQLLIRRFHSPAQRAEIVRRAAGWLRWFHSHSEIETAGFDAAVVRTRLERMQNKLHQTNGGPGEGDPFLRDCVARAHLYAAEMADTPLLHAAVHGDYTPFNLFLGPTKAYGFDFNENKRQHVHQDICRFLLYLDTYRLRPPRDAELARYGGRRNDYETFFGAYGEDAAPSREVWLALQFIEITRRLASITLQRSRGKGHLLRVVETPFLRRKARLIARQLG